MTVEELEKQVEKLRTGPLLLVCRTPAGKEKAMSIRECMETGSRFLHVAADELDNLLEQELGGRTGAASAARGRNMFRVLVLK